MSIKRVIFIRPGETEWNRLGRQQGWAAVPLNANGELQVKRLARFIRNIGVRLIYSSDLSRSKHTATILAKELGVEPRFEARLRERHVGQWQGLTLDEIKDWYANEYQSLHVNNHGYQIPGGEARDEVEKRVLAVFDDILARGGAESIAIVSHTIAIRTLLASLTPDFDADSFHPANMSVTTIKKEGESWQIVELNDISHLEGMPTQAVIEPDED